VADDQLAAPTPCPEYTVGDLLDHVGGLAKAFTWAATKESLAMPDLEPSGDASRLEPAGGSASPATSKPSPTRGRTRRPGPA
jgi:hypothetical protein